MFFKMLKRKERIAVRGQILKEQPGGGAITCGFGDKDKGREKVLLGVNAIRAKNKGLSFVVFGHLLIA